MVQVYCLEQILRMQWQASEMRSDDGKGGLASLFPNAKELELLEPHNSMKFLKAQIAAFYYAMNIPYFQYYQMFSRRQPQDEVLAADAISEEEHDFIKTINNLVV